MQLNRYVSQLRPSPTLALNQKAKTLKAQGKSIINLTAGEPDFPTPDRICRAAKAAIDRGESKYTAVGGIPELKTSILRQMEKEYSRTFSAKECLVSCGAKHSLFNLCIALLNPGDEAIVIAPYWVSYSDMVELVGAKAVVVHATEKMGFEPAFDDIRAAINKKTRLLFLNSPCNPTGVVFRRALLESIAGLLKQFPDLLVVTDDIYGKLIFDDDPFVSIGMLPEVSKDQLVIVNGVSKTYAMTGWRIGYAVGPAPLIEAMENVQSQSTSNPTSVAQWAAVEALDGEQSDVNDMKQIFKQRRDKMLQGLENIPGLRCVKPQGAFYLFPSVSNFIGKKSKIKSDEQLAAYLLENHGLATVPGSAFGAPGYLRLSYGASPKDLEEGIARLAKGLKEL